VNATMTRVQLARKGQPPRGARSKVSPRSLRRPALRCARLIPQGVGRAQRLGLPLGPQPRAPKMAACGSCCPVAGRIARRCRERVAHARAVPRAVAGGAHSHLRPTGIPTPVGAGTSLSFMRPAGGWGTFREPSFPSSDAMDSAARRWPGSRDDVGRRGGPRPATGHPGTSQFESGDWGQCAVHHTGPFCGKNSRGPTQN